jgi:hypothetical protein
MRAVYVSKFSEKSIAHISTGVDKTIKKVWY